LISSFYLTKH